MSVQKGVFTLLLANEDLAAAMGVPLDQLGDHLHRTGAAVDVPVPFLSIRWEDDNLVSHFGTHRMSLRAHDRDESYQRIDAMLDAAKRQLTAVVHEQGITQADWRGRSPDLADDGYKTLTRYDTYDVAGGLTTGKD